MKLSSQIDWMENRMSFWIIFITSNWFVFTNTILISGLDFTVNDYEDCKKRCTSFYFCLDYVFRSDATKNCELTLQNDKKETKGKLFSVIIYVNLTESKVCYLPIIFLVYQLLFYSGNLIISSLKKKLRLMSISLFIFSFCFKFHRTSIGNVI